MEKLVEQVQPADRAASSGRPSSSQGSLSVSASDSGVLCSGSASEAEYPPTSLSIASSDSLGTTTKGGLSNKLRSVRGALFDIYPSQHDVDIILANPTGKRMADKLLYSENDSATGRAESLREALRRPPAHTHPVILAKRLLRFALCLHHMSPTFDPVQLDARRSTTELADAIVSSVTTLVCLDDELVCCAEGLEVLSLHMMCHISVGNLRKAWLVVRRGLSLGELMGANTQGRHTALPYCDPASDPLTRPRPVVVWFHLNDFERYLSLLLGLPAASRDEAFRTMGREPMLSPMEKMEVAHGLITGRVIERNLSGMEDYMAMLEINCELKQAAEAMPAAWWELPGDADADDGSISTLMLQSRHYNLVMMLHLPYILRPREPRFAHSKASCLAASREVLARYSLFRSLYARRMSCRHMDFFSLVASMTLVLGYLGAREEGPGEWERRVADRRLVEEVRMKMKEQAAMAGDKMTGEAAEVVGQLMPIIDRGVSTCAEAREAVRKGLRLKIPYLGTVSIADGDGEGVSMGKLAGAPGWEEGVGGEEVGTGGAGAHEPRDEAYYADACLHLSVDTGLVDPVPLQGGLGGAGTGLDDVPGGLDMDPALLLDESAIIQPGLTADAEDWSFQGIDTTYWSLLNGGFSG